MGEIQEAIKPEPILPGWRREKEFKDEIKPEPVVSGRTFSIIMGIGTIISAIEGSFESLTYIFLLISIFIGKKISDKEKNNKEKEGFVGVE
ncbi:hypothetical protein DRN58_00175 [Thermococci archaeon]|nr:MAG: hypothetical protein DRN58_00175 [Thermococci archaeon]